MSKPPGEHRVAPLPRPLQRLVEDARARWWAASAPPPDSAAERLGRILDDRGLRVAYQPIVELVDRRLVAVEALVRLEGDHPGLGSATELIAVAESSELIHAVGTEVLARACSQVAAWRAEPHLADLQVHVNVSPLQLRDARFTEIVERTLEVTGLPPTALVLELTETAAFEMNATAEAALATLSARDVEIAIDDFGTGFASLEMLASTPARSIKLDRSFVDSVDEITAPPRGRGLVVQAAIGLGRALGLRVVAEGVETVAQARTLAAWGCVYGQGYLYARPEPFPPLVLEAPPVVDADRPAVRRRVAHLSSDALDLAIALAVVSATSDPQRGTVRADAQEAALLLAEAMGVDRRQADTAAVLATIADAPQRFADVIGARSPVGAAIELARVLDARGDLGPDAHPGAVAAAARRLAVARRDGSNLDDAWGTVAGGADTTVRDRVATWWTADGASPSPLRALRAMERRLRSRDDAARRLRALSALTHAIGGAGALEDVLEVTAEEARTAVGAASLTIARLERERGLLRVLVNVGDLAAWEERRPEDSVYAVSEFPRAVARLLDRSIHLEVAGADKATGEARLLADYERGSSASVPIVVDGATWGVVYATTSPGAPPFTAADTPFLTAIASVVSVAIRRFAHVDELTRLAGEDPLTRLANRRALEEHLSRALAPGDGRPDVALLLLDVEGLNRVNATLGHGEGDRMLVRVADVIARVALTEPGAFPARLGGDEFCIVLEGTGHAVEPLVDRIRARLADGSSPRPSVSAGLASVRAGTVAVSELLRRADAAQYLAKRTGAPLAAVGPDSAIPDPEARSEIVREADDGPSVGGGATGAALRLWGATLKETSLSIRLEGLGEAAGALLDLNRWALSTNQTPSDTFRTHRVHIRRRRPGPPEFAPADDQSVSLSDHPAAVMALREGVGYSVHVDDAAGDASERVRLTRYGQEYVLAIPAHEGEQGWLLELYGDALSTLLPEARPVVEALGSRTLGAAVVCPPARPR